jgi:hypothetical protein
VGSYYTTYDRAILLESTAIAFTEACAMQHTCSHNSKIESGVKRAEDFRLNLRVSSAQA